MNFIGFVNFVSLVCERQWCSNGFQSRHDLAYVENYFNEPSYKFAETIV